MSVAPLSTLRSPRLSQPPSRGHRPPSGRSIAGRRRFVMLAKRALPLMAVLLLATVMLWPQIIRQFDFGHSAKAALRDIREGRLVNLRYHGVDDRGQPYTVTAAEAQQIGPERIDLVSPKADVLGQSGTWTLVTSENGVYLQHVNQLDLSGHVVIYRDNGVTLKTQTAAVDLKAGAAAGSDRTHAEGPFGTLDAQGFAFVDKGAVVQFDGKSRLVLNEQHQ